MDNGATSAKFLELEPPLPNIPVVTSVSEAIDVLKLASENKYVLIPIPTVELWRGYAIDAHRWSVKSQDAYISLAQKTVAWSIIAQYALTAAGFRLP